MILSEGADPIKRIQMYDRIVRADDVPFDATNKRVSGDGFSHYEGLFIRRWHRVH